MSQSTEWSETALSVTNTKPGDMDPLNYRGQSEQVKGGKVMRTTKKGKKKPLIVQHQSVSVILCQRLFFSALNFLTFDLPPFDFFIEGV